MVTLEELNKNQREAVLWNEGSMLVLAGPGSGKTRVLTTRVARLLEEKEEAAVLALTFTNKAAAEMRERVDRLLGQRADKAHLCTFHSFATDTLRQHGVHVGIRPDFTLLVQDEDRLALLEPVVQRMEKSGGIVAPDRRNLLGLLDRLFSESYEGGPQAPSLTTTPRWLPELFTSYSAALVAANRLDFGTLLHFTRRLLSEKVGVARVVRLAWSYVCVDEFQDTNKAQYDLLRLIAGEGTPNLFIVADDDQIIYQWNGASPERLSALQRDYAMEVVQLPENYRCPAVIIDIANLLIAHNRQRASGKKPLAAMRPREAGVGVIRCQAFETPEDEAAFIPADMSARKLSPSSVAVLARTTSLLEKSAAALGAAGYSVFVPRKKNEFETPVVAVMYGVLRLANARHDREVLRRACVAWRELAGSTIEVEGVAAASGLHGGDFLRAWGEAASAGRLEEACQGLLAEIQNGLIDRLEFPDIVDWFLSEGAKSWSTADDPEVAVEIETWASLHRDIVREHSPGDLSLNAYLQQMDLASKAPVPAPGAVRCMTVHGAKGLEFGHVYLIGMADEVFPSYHALQKGPGSAEVEEERRSCFVAVTRVQETLTMTRAKQYYGWRKNRSQFLTEMGLPG